jgi:septum formation protein
VEAHPATGAAAEPSRLILASGSPRRRELLTAMGLAFDVIPASVIEWEAADADPAALVEHNAALKAQAVSRLHPERPILASDTTVALGAEVLNKPADLAEAKAMLRRLSGQRHIVHTAVSLRWPGMRPDFDFRVESTVVFRPFDDATIDRYCELVNTLDKAGAYGIQEHREMIIDHWEGSLHNIMGLPTERLQTVFEQEGWWSVLEMVG